MNDTPEVAAILDLLGEERTQSNVQHMTMLLHAFRVYVERNERHHDTWRQSGWRGALFDSHKKMDRLWNEFMISDDPPKDYDSAVDLINFVVFFMRGHMNKVEGTWQWSK